MACGALRLHSTAVAAYVENDFATEDPPTPQHGSAPLAEDSPVLHPPIPQIPADVEESLGLPAGEPRTDYQPAPPVSSELEYLLALQESEQVADDIQSQQTSAEEKSLALQEVGLLAHDLLDPQTSAEPDDSDTMGLKHPLKYLGRISDLTQFQRTLEILFGSGKIWDQGGMLNVLVPFFATMWALPSFFLAPHAYVHVMPGARTHAYDMYYPIRANTHTLSITRVRYVPSHTRKHAHTVAHTR